MRNISDFRASTFVLVGLLFWLVLTSLLANVWQNFDALPSPLPAALGQSRTLASKLAASIHQLFVVPLHKLAGQRGYPNGIY